MAVATSPQKKYTYEDYLLLPDDDGQRYEIIDGELFVNPAPSRKHQYVIGNLHLIFAPYVRRHRCGELYFAPLDVVLSPIDVVQPDLLYITKEHADLMNEKNLQGSPDFAVEVLSESSKRKDEVLKLKRYEAFGVSEYWIVDPFRDRVQVFRRNGDRLERMEEASLENQDVLSSPFFPGLTVDLREVFEAP